MFKIKPTAELLRERGLQPGGRAQKYVDSEVIRCVDKYVPFNTGFLKKSVRLGSVIGSGVLKYVAPYARKNYYENAGKGKQGLNAAKKKGFRGRLWFERMKVVYLQHILEGVAKVTGGTIRRR